MPVKGDLLVINSRAKGNRGEREFAKFLRANGFSEARRGQQYSGIEGEDVVGLRYIHIECKRIERLNIQDALDQSIRDKKEETLPIVAYRKNRGKWIIFMTAEDWLKLYSVADLEKLNEQF